MSEQWCIGNITGSYLWHEDIGGILPMSPGKAKRYDYEYGKQGSCCVFLAFDPHRKFRYVEVRDRRTAVDYAEFMQCLLTCYYPQAEKIGLVQDNLNTHTPGAFYEILSADQAFELGTRFELHYTPKKGSWLNMAEIELAALCKQCLSGRIADVVQLRQEVLAWAGIGNQKRCGVAWTFAKADARANLGRHYTDVNKLF
ncbi:MAG: transposase [Chlorobi bacterium]|nr:transposase [Chlorobiota bacterium]